MIERKTYKLGISCFHSGTLRESREEEDQEILGGEIEIDGKIWNVWHKTEQGGGLSSVAFAPPRCNRHKHATLWSKSKIWSARNLDVEQGIWIMHQSGATCLPADSFRDKTL